MPTSTTGAIIIIKHFSASRRLPSNMDTRPTIPEIRPIDITDDARFARLLAFDWTPQLYSPYTIEKNKKTIKPGMNNRKLVTELLAVSRCTIRCLPSLTISTVLERPQKIIDKASINIPTKAITAKLSPIGPYAILSVSSKEKSSITITAMMNKNIAMYLSRECNISRL